MSYILNKIKLQVIINTLNAKTLTRSKISELTSSFSKADVLKHKKKIFAKLVAKAPRTIEENKQLKKVAREFKLSFNIESNKLIKKHLQESKEFNSRLRPIDFTDFKLLKDEEAYLKLSNGVFFDVPHIKNLDYKKYKYLVLTNKRLILVFGKNKNSYYFNHYIFTNAIKFILIKDQKNKKPGIFLLSRNNSKLLMFIKKLKGED